MQETSRTRAIARFVGEQPGFINISTYRGLKNDNGKYVWFYGARGNLFSKTFNVILPFTRAITDLEACTLGRGWGFVTLGKISLPPFTVKTKWLKSLTNRIFYKASPITSDKGKQS